MLAVVNRLAAKEGAAGRIVERFAEGRGMSRGYPGFLSMELTRAEEVDEMLVVTRWQNRASFEAWVRSDELSPPSALPVPTLTPTIVK